MRLEPILSPDLTFIIEGAADRDAVLMRFAEVAAKRSEVHSAEAIYGALQAREQQTPTATEEGVAFPHAMLGGLEQTLLIVARLKPAVSFGGTDLPAPDLVFCMIGSTEKPWEHVRLLARLARIARGAGGLDRLRKAHTSDELFAALVEEDRAHG